MFHKGLPIAFILLAGLVVQQLLRFLADKLKNTVQRQSEGTASERSARATTLTNVFFATASTVAWFIAGLMILDKLSINIGPLITGAGVVGFAVGFGSQELVKDMFSGLFFLYENQFNTGDYLLIKDKRGKVKEMNLRTVTLKGDAGEDIIFRNSQIDIVTKMPKGYATPAVTPGASS